jgi:hypothetical protein
MSTVPPPEPDPRFSPSAPSGGPQPPPEGTPPGPDLLARAEAAAREKVLVPALMLIVVGIANLVLALIPLFFGGWVLTMPLGQFDEMMRKSAEQNPWAGRLNTPEEVAQAKTLGGSFYLAEGIVPIPLAVVILFAGVRMRQLRSYGLAVTGSFLAAIPCLSCSACCVLGEIAGIWALVVLFNSEVRAVFR